MLLQYAVNKSCADLCRVNDRCERPGGADGSEGDGMTRV